MNTRSKRKNTTQTDCEKIDQKNKANNHKRAKGTDADCIHDVFGINLSKLNGTPLPVKDFSISDVIKLKGNEMKTRSIVASQLLNRSLDRKRSKPNTPPPTEQSQNVPKRELSPKLSDDILLNPLNHVQSAKLSENAPKRKLSQNVRSSIASKNKRATNALSKAVPNHKSEQNLAKLLKSERSSKKTNSATKHILPPSLPCRKLPKIPLIRRTNDDLSKYCSGPLVSSAALSGEVPENSLLSNLPSPGSPVHRPSTFVPRQNTKSHVSSKNGWSPKVSSTVSSREALENSSIKELSSNISSPGSPVHRPSTFVPRRNTESYESSKNCSGSNVSSTVSSREPLENSWNQELSLNISSPGSPAHRPPMYVPCRNTENPELPTNDPRPKISSNIPERELSSNLINPSTNVPSNVLRPSNNSTVTESPKASTLTLAERSILARANPGGRTRSEPMELELPQWAPVPNNRFDANLFSTLCQRFLWDDCDSTNCPYPHVLPSRQELHQIIFHVVSPKVVLQTYDSIVCRCKKLFTEYFSTFAEFFGEKKLRWKLEQMISDVVHPKRQCISHLYFLMKAFCKSGLTYCAALRTIIDGMETKTVESNRIILMLMLDKSPAVVFQFLDELTEMSRNKRMPFEVETLWKLVQITNQYQHRVLLRIIWRVFKRDEKAILALMEKPEFEAFRQFTKTVVQENGGLETTTKSAAKNNAVNSMDAKSDASRNVAPEQTLNEDGRDAPNPIPENNN